MLKLTVTLLSILLITSLLAVSEMQKTSAVSENHLTIEGYYNIAEKRYEDGRFSYEHYLFVDEGNTKKVYKLEFENPTNELFDLSGNIVHVKGYMKEFHAKDAKSQSVKKTMHAESIELKQQISKRTDNVDERAVPSPLKSVTVLLKYSGNTAEPHSEAYFEGRFYDDADSLAAYWSDTSYGALSLSKGATDGTGVINWVTLPKTQAQYADVDGFFDATLARSDALPLVDSLIDFNGADNIIQNTGPQIGSGNNGDDVDQIMFIHNDEFVDPVNGAFAFAYFDPLPISTAEGTIYMYVSHGPDLGSGFAVGTGFENGVGVMAHEMGHNFEWLHTPPPSGLDTYADPWSLMSGGDADGPPGTIAFNRDQASWIPSADKITVASGSQSTFTLDILSDSSPGANYLMGIVPIGSSGDYYTIEARKDATFDQTPLDQMGIMIYRYYNTLPRPSGPEPSAPVTMVDTTGTGDFTNADLDGGNTYSDTTNRIYITSISQTSTTITVNVQNDPPCSPPASGDWIVNASCTMSSSATAPANVIVQNNSVLTIPSGVTLNIDFTTKYLLVESGSGVLVKAGGKIT